MTSPDSENQAPETVEVDELAAEVADSSSSADDDELDAMPMQNDGPAKRKRKDDDDEVPIPRPKTVLTIWEPDKTHLWRMTIPPQERGSAPITHPETGEFRNYHPRNDDELYGFLDDDDRPAEEYRFEFNEAMFDSQFRAMLKDNGQWGGVINKVIGGLVVGVVIAYLWWLFAGKLESSGGVLDVFLGVIAAIPVFAIFPVVLLFPAGGYLWGMNQAYKAMMAMVYIVDGHKRIIVCHYPNELMAGRGDQLTTGEFVLSLEPCCRDPYCEHPLRLLYERDLEKGLRSAVTTGVVNAREKYDIVRRVALIAKHAPTVPFNPTERVAKMLPYIIISVCCGIGALLLFTSNTGGA